MKPGEVLIEEIIYYQNKEINHLLEARFIKLYKYVSMFNVSNIVTIKKEDSRKLRVYIDFGELWFSLTICSNRTHGECYTLETLKMADDFCSSSIYPL